MHRHQIARIAGALLLATLVAPPARAGEAEKTAPFELGRWIELGATDGPVTLHRIRVLKEGGVTKSKLFRPGNSEYLTDVRIELEYTNEGSHDWEARLHVSWLDGAGDVIDGYNDGENLDSDSRLDKVTVTLSTLRYGLDRAKSLRIRIGFAPD